MDQEKIGNLIKKLRKQNNLTQNAFAKKYGVTYQAVSNWEQGKNLPDVALLKQISEDFNISLDELLGGNPKNNKKIFIMISLIIVFLIVSITVIILLNHNDNFEFKTLSTTCADFNISGSIAYNKNKTSIYINNVDYCGGDDKTSYENIECVLYEVHGNTQTKIDSCHYDNKESITLENYLKEVNFTVGDYAQSCKKYSDNSLVLKINATDKKGKITSYDIPLSLKDTCSFK